MASLNELEGDTIETVLFVAVMVVLFIALWIYFKAKKAGDGGLSFWNAFLQALLKALDAVQAKMNVFFNGTIDRLTTANLGGNNVAGDVYGGPGQYDVATGISSTSAEQWAQYPLSGVNQ